MIFVLAKPIKIAIALALICMVFIGCAGLYIDLTRDYGRQIAHVFSSQYNIKTPKEIGVWARQQNEGHLVMHSGILLLHLASTKRGRQQRDAIQEFEALYMDMHKGWHRHLEPTAIDGVRRRPRDAPQADYEAWMLERWHATLSQDVSLRTRSITRDLLYRLPTDRLSEIYMERRRLP